MPPGCDRGKKRNADDAAAKNTRIKKQKTMFSFFNRSALDKAKRLTQQAERAEKDAEIHTAAAELHAKKEGERKRGFFEPGYQISKEARQKEKELAARRVGKGLQMPVVPVGFCERVDFAHGEEGRPRAECGVFGCNCSAFSRLRKHANCRCGHNAAQHRVKALLPPFPLGAIGSMGTKAAPAFLLNGAPFVPFDAEGHSRFQMYLGEMREWEEAERLSELAAARRAARRFLERKAAMAKRDLLCELLEAARKAEAKQQGGTAKKTAPSKLGLPCGGAEPGGPAALMRGTRGTKAPRASGIGPRGWAQGPSPSTRGPLVGGLAPQRRSEHQAQPLN